MTEFIQTLIEEFGWKLEPGFKQNEIIVRRAYLGPISWVKSEYCIVRVLADKGIVSILGAGPGLHIELADPQSIDGIMDWFNSDAAWWRPTTKELDSHAISDKVLLPGEDVDDLIEDLF